MKLKSVHIKNFRCVENSGEFSVGDLTCLVGKNESGKTSVLQALVRLNPSRDEHKGFDVDRDFPRHRLTDFDEDESPDVVLTSWELDDSDVSAVEEVIGAGALKDRTITVTKGYADKGQRWVVPLDESAVIQHLLTFHGCTATEKLQFKTCTSVADLTAKARAIPDDKASERIKTLIASVAKWRDGKVSSATIDALGKRLPKILYFANYDRMNGDVSLEQLQRNVSKGDVDPGDKVFQSFLKFAGTSVEDIASLDRYEKMKARVEAASLTISKRIFRFWSQNRHLKVQFSLEAGRPGDPAPFNSGSVMRTRILNELHGMTVPFDDRSAGFVWFFSFLVLFTQVQKEQGNVIILLDEPGLNLHAKAQADLLRFINEELRGAHQVIYTTHSPFMVPADELACVRTVEDVVKYGKDGVPEEVLGTKVGDDVLSTDRDTLFPLQSALGYEISQSLFVGPHALVVEGPSDLLYLQAASAELTKRGLKGLDRRWTVCPSGGIDKVAAFISLFGGNKLHVAVLADYASGQKGKVESLRKSKLLQDGHVLLVNDFCDREEADVEDLFGAELYCKLVNESLELKGKSALKAADLTGEGKPIRIVKAVEGELRLQTSAPEFDHYLPARWLIGKPQWLEGDADGRSEALDRFAALFEKINSLL